MFSGIAEFSLFFKKQRSAHVGPGLGPEGSGSVWKLWAALQGGSGPFRRFRRCEGHILRGSAWPLRILIRGGSFWFEKKVSESLNGFFSGSESSGASRFWRLPWSVDLTLTQLSRPRLGTCWPKEIWRVNLPCEVWSPEICTPFMEETVQIGIKSPILGSLRPLGDGDLEAAVGIRRAAWRKHQGSTQGAKHENLKQWNPQWLNDPRNPPTHHLFKTPCHLSGAFREAFATGAWIWTTPSGELSEKVLVAGWRELAGFGSPHLSNEVASEMAVFSTKAVFFWVMEMPFSAEGSYGCWESKNSEFFLGVLRGNVRMSHRFLCLSECGCQSRRHFPQTWLKTENSGKLLPEMKEPMVLKCLRHLQLTHIQGCPTHADSM